MSGVGQPDYSLVRFFRKVPLTLTLSREQRGEGALAWRPASILPARGEKVPAGG
jgi:hypothetical protein